MASSCDLAATSSSSMSSFSFALHQHAAGRYGGVHGALADAEDHVPVEVGRVHWRRGDIIHYRQVGGEAFFQLAQAFDNDALD